MDHNQMNKVIKSLSKLINDTEKVALPVFAVKLAKASANYPEDKTLGTMYDIVSRMSDNKLFITRAEIKDLYNKLYTRNTKFAELFQNELGAMPVEEKKVPAAYVRDGEGVVENDGIDPVLANALNVAFGGSSKAYDQKIANAAKSVVERECSSQKLPAVVEVVSRNDKFVVCCASFDTPKGKTSVYVPIEIYAGKALLPSIYIANEGPQDFSKVSIQNYVIKNAGCKLNINQNVVASVVASAINGDLNKISNVDFALIKLQESRENTLPKDGILGQTVQDAPVNLEVKMPEYKDSEIDTFASKLNSQAGLAEFGFGKEKVKIASSLVSKKLESIGFKNYQMSIMSSDKTGILFAVAGNNVAFKVPVRIFENKVISPELMIANGGIKNFDQESVAEMFKEESVDYQIAAVASPQYGLKASELLDIVKASMAVGNFAKAEDALNVLANSGDQKAYKIAFEEYTSGLSGVKVAAPQVKCNNIVKNAHTKHLLCGHTGLPLHKVVQNQYGECITKHRSEMDNTSQGSYMKNSKIFQQ